MKLPELSVKRPVTTLMAFLLIVVLGLVSTGRLNMDLLPKMNFPVAAVITTYSGAGPQEVENLITRPIEETLGTVANVTNLTSSSAAEQSIVIAEFNWGTDMDFALLDVREKLDLIKGYLPDGADSPMVFKFDPSMMPVMTLAVSGTDDLVALKTLVDEEIKPRLERIEGVASVGVSGGLTRVIKVSVDQAKLNSYGLSLQTIIQTLQAENLNLPGGSVRSGDLEFMVRTTGEFSDVSQIADLNILSPTGIMVKLKEVAEVADTVEDGSAYVLLNGKTAVSLSISKETDGNTVNVSRAVRKEMEKIRAELPGDINFDVVMDQAQYIQFALDGLKDNAIMGGLLAVIILLLFLRNFTSTLIISISIPVSIIATFVLVYFAGLNLNMMTLGGLALGVGMLVDNAIVVLENIYRYRQLGHSAVEAAVNGASEVGLAITASTLTTVIVFLPVVFTSGLTSEIFKELSLTIAFSLLASLLVALTLVPMLSSKLLKLGRTQVVANPETVRIKGITKWYKAILAWCLNHRKTTIAFTTLAFVASLALIPRIGAEFLPAMDSGEFTIDIVTAKGTVLEETEKIVAKVDEILAGIPEIEAVTTTVGTSIGMDYSTSFTTQGDRAGYYVRLVNSAERKRSTNEIIEEIRQKTAGLVGADITVQSLSMMSLGGSVKPINVKIQGPNLDTLREISADLVELIKNVEGTREVESSIDDGRPELLVSLDRNRASALGLNAYTVASHIRTAVQGTTATRYRVDGEEVNVVVTLADKDSRDLLALHNLLIPSPLGVTVPLSEVAELKVVEGPNTISRENQQRTVYVSADIVGRDLKSVTTDIQAIIDRYPLDALYEIQLSGQSEEMISAFSDLFLALGLAVLLVYMLLAAQFESLVHPFTIMTAVPLALIGVLIGLFVSGQNLSVVSIIGVIMLAGIVVNNSIVLVDFTNILRRRDGLSTYEALLATGPIRLRPIMMTALTTILGLIPLAFSVGEGSELQKPLAVVVIGGLTVSTILTLVVVPVIYYSIDNWGQKIRRLFSRKQPTEQTVEV
ncbi:MAG: efflux RND transporter permease subunit [Firmicutes bacterium]|nr:efflux RND transporter permease subunit [Bacillota bacterium]